MLSNLLTNLNTNVNIKPNLNTNVNIKPSLYFWDIH
jgi:hypothetical protein